MLRITFHESTFTQAPGEEQAALETLYELAHLPDVDALTTESGRLPYLIVGPLDDDRGFIPITVRDGDTIVTHGGIGVPNQWPEIAVSLVGREDRQHPEVQGMLADVLVAQAHRELRRDILITLSPRLLGQRTSAFVRDANPMRPSAAAKLIGLLLRTRDNYIVSADAMSRLTVNRGLFYLVLTRYRLPNMWRYFSTCVAAAEVRRDDILHIGQSILIRSKRALEARDAIGMQFYIPQNNDTRDVMMYHFEYLTLMLAGALDAQARVAYRAYTLPRPRREREASFRREEFQEALRDAGALALHAIVTAPRFRAVTTLLNEIRNTVHGAGFPTFAVGVGAGVQESFVEVLPEYEDTLWAAAEDCGGAEPWGMVRQHTLRFEPYTYATRLTAECLGLIDLIAAATDVIGLFPPGHPVPPLEPGPPLGNEIFTGHTHDRIVLLG